MTDAVATAAATQSNDVIFAMLRLGFAEPRRRCAAWNSSVTDGGDLSVTVGAAFVGSYGMQAIIDDTTAIYVTDDTPNAEPR